MTNLPPQFATMREQHIAGPQVEVLGEDQTIEVVTLCAMCSDGESAGMHWPCDTIKALDALAQGELDNVRLRKELRLWAELQNANGWVDAEAVQEALAQGADDDQ